MKLFAHYMFSWMLAVIWVHVILGYPGYEMVGAAFLISLIVNVTIDAFGHEHSFGNVSRNPITHSVFTAPLWGLAVGLAFWYFFGMPLLAFAGMGIICAVGHLMLDFVTMRGIFITPGWRVGVLHLRYDTAWNIVVAVGSLLLLAYVVL